MTDVDGKPAAVPARARPLADAEFERRKLAAWVFILALVVMIVLSAALTYVILARYVH